MKRAISVIINRAFKDELELLYGKDAEIIIENVKYCTINKHYLVSCKLLVSDIELFAETDVAGINYMVEESWKYLGESSIVAVLSSVDVK